MILDVLIIDHFHKDVILKLKDIPELNIMYAPGLLEEEILARLSNISILILRTTYTVTNEWLEIAKKLKMILVGGNGINHLPRKELLLRNIVLENVRSASVNAVVEYGICLILMGLRKLPQGLLSIKEGKWAKNKLLGKELNNNSIGLVGLGQIGNALADKLSVFNTSVLFCDRLHFDVPYREASMETLFSHCDVICIQVPLNQETENLIGFKYFDMLKEDAIVINLSRYEVLNMNDLHDFLTIKRRTQNFFIDPIEQENLKDVNKFESLPVTFLPHLGANTLETQLKVANELVFKVKKFVSNKMIDV